VNTAPVSVGAVVSQKLGVPAHIRKQAERRSAKRPRLIAIKEVLAMIDISKVDITKDQVLAELQLHNGREKASTSTTWSRASRTRSCAARPRNARCAS
jgi:predicted transposase YbfD/YdcC